MLYRINLSVITLEEPDKELTTKQLTELVEKWKKPLKVVAVEAVVSIAKNDTVLGRIGTLLKQTQQ